MMKLLKEPIKEEVRVLVDGYEKSLEIEEKMINDLTKFILFSKSNYK